MNLIKNLKIILTAKIIITWVFLFLGAYFYFDTDNLIFLIASFVLTIFLFHNIIKQIDTTNRELTRFLLSIKYSDFSQNFSTSNLGKSFQDLSNAFNEVMDKFRDTRNEKEEQNRYLQTVLRHVGVGLLSFDTSGKIEFINHAARKMLAINRITNITVLNKLNNSFSEKLINLKAGERTTIKIYDEEDVIQLIIYATEFKMRNNLYKLVSLQNIQSELEEKELEAWQKLIRVLTHEIMNSVTPISSLASTVNVLLTNGNKDDLDAEEIDDIKSAINTIQRRSEGLINFVENYRNLTKIPKPNFEIISVAQLFKRVEKLLDNDLKQSSINFFTRVEPESLELTADQNLIEQILINLIINAVHALANCHNKRIDLNAHLNERGRVIIKVTDNGPGIPEDIQEKIFIPFFSTKSNGSGIGLSLARQIMRAHRGNIRVSSIPNEGTIFTLVF